VTDQKPYCHRFPMTIIQQAVWLYHRFSLSFLARAAPMRTLGRYRDVQELLHQRGIVVRHETLRECLG
jgi:putative transposase